MTFFGIALRKPSFNEVTAATVMAVGLWVAAVGIAHASGHDIDHIDAGALLVVSLWGCVGARLGLRLGQGRRHLVANLGVSALLLGLYQGAIAFVA